MPDITERARSLVALYDRSGKPAILPDTPAGRMLLRESIAILRDEIEAYHEKAVREAGRG
jgi:hypothetical protein